jgi:disulfide bond formation protein DsbB
MNNEMNATEVKLRIRILNIIEILGIQFILIFTLGFQVFLHDLPCPLCLLQRVGFFGIIIGLLMNLRFGLKPFHYSIILLSALFTSLVALRHIVINVVPDGGYGNPFLGLHLYTWSFIISTTILVFTTLVLGINRQFQYGNPKMGSHWTTHTLLAVTTFIFALNLILLL